MAFLSNYVDHKTFAKITAPLKKLGRTLMNNLDTFTCIYIHVHSYIQ